MKSKILYWLLIITYIVMFLADLFIIAYKILTEVVTRLKDQLFDFSTKDIILNTIVYIVTLLLLSYLIYLISKETQKFKKYILIFFVSLFIISNSVIIGEFYFDYLHSFYSYDKWKDKPNERVNIYYDMIKKLNLNKLTKSQIIKELGTPEKKPSGSVMTNDQSVDLMSDKTIYYYLGPVPWDYDGKYLYIKFDNNDKVLEYKVFSFVT